MIRAVWIWAGRGRALRHHSAKAMPMTSQIAPTSQPLMTSDNLCSISVIRLKPIRKAITAVPKAALAACAGVRLHDRDQHPQIEHRPHPHPDQIEPRKAKKGRRPPREPAVIEAPFHETGQVLMSPVPRADIRVFADRGPDRMPDRQRERRKPHHSRNQGRLSQGEHWHQCDEFQGRQTHQSPVCEAPASSGTQSGGRQRKARSLRYARQEPKH